MIGPFHAPAASMSGDDRIVAPQGTDSQCVLIRIHPLIEARPADKPASAQRDAGQRRQTMHLAQNDVMDMGLRAAQLGCDFGNGQHMSAVTVARRWCVWVARIADLVLSG